MSETNEMHSLRIFTIISQIEQLLESAPRPKLGGGNTKRLIDISEVFDLLGDLKVTIPEDIRRANSVLIEADTLLEHANQDAVDIVDTAQKEADALVRKGEAELERSRLLAEEEFEARVCEDSVLLEVQRRCELLQQHAQNSANVVYDGAKQYADAILLHLQNYLMENYNRVEKNREELGVTVPLSSQPQPQYQQPEQSRPQQRDPVQPVPVVSAEPEPIPQEEEQWEPPRKKRSIFQRMDDDLFIEDEEALEEQAEFANNPPAQRRKGRRSAKKPDDLDLDLEE